MQLTLKRKQLKFVSDESRVITRFFNPGGEQRIKNIIKRVMSLSEKRCSKNLQAVLESFNDRHRDFERILMEHYQSVKPYIKSGYRLTKNRQLLVGAYFTSEYSVESVALFNPSVVLHPDQYKLPEGSIRCIFSFRAIGEGHVSSIVFRSGIIDEDHQIYMDNVTRFVDTPSIELNPLYDQKLLKKKLKEDKIWTEVSREVFSNLGNRFHFQELQQSITDLCKARTLTHAEQEIIEIIFWLVRSNYEVSFDKQNHISERVLFPVARSEKNGIEDARFVKFARNNEKAIYYATYSAYNGRTILPMLLETRDFQHFKIRTLSGENARGKGMALFPRKINGKFALLSRQDGENMYVSYSDDICFWQDSKLLQSPKESWEYVQIGNCGSPLETKKGWLVLTHGVGPMRTYCIGADLLDLENPSKVLGRLKSPLIAPNEYEREGYVPNVVYTCGAIIHNEMLVIPYAFSDSESGIAMIELKQLLKALLP